MTAELSAISSGFPRQLLRRPTSIVLTLAVGLLLVPVNSSAGEALSKTEVIRMLNSSEPSLVKELAIKLKAKHYGIAFEMTQDVEKELKAAGASEGLLQTLRALAPKPPPIRERRAIPVGTYKLESLQMGLKTYEQNGEMQVTKVSDEEYRFSMSLFRPGVLAEEYQGKFTPDQWGDWSLTVESESENNKNDLSYHNHWGSCTDIDDNNLTIFLDTNIMKWAKQ